MFLIVSFLGLPGVKALHCGVRWARRVQVKVAGKRFVGGAIKWLLHDASRRFGSGLNGGDVAPACRLEQVPHKIGYSLLLNDSPTASWSYFTPVWTTVGVLMEPCWRVALRAAGRWAFLCKPIGLCLPCGCAGLVAGLRFVYAAS